MDPYVKMQISSKVFRTKTHTNGGKCPSWNEAFEFKRATEDIIYVYVYDEDSATSDDLIGEGRFNLSTVCSGGNNKFADYIPLTYKGKSAGDIYLDIIFYADAATIPTAPSMQVPYPGGQQPAYGAFPQPYSAPAYPPAPQCIT